MIRINAGHTRTRKPSEPTARLAVRLSPIALGLGLMFFNSHGTNAQTPNSITATDSASSSSSSSTSNGNNGFATRHARYVNADWAKLPGWGDETGHEALAAFRTGCASLGKREGWAAACDAARRSGARDPVSARIFFEQNFDLLQLREPNNADTGVITGYFEPLLRGSKIRAGAFLHPVYPIPDDLLYLDAREFAARTPGKSVFGRVRERSIELLRETEAVVAADPRQGVFLIDIGSGIPDIRDKRIRVQVVGDRIRPYPTRQEIEQAGLRNARPIAWVDSAEALYSMQIQGSGKIQLADGTMIRVAYAEQNGHPFLPKVTTARSDGIRTRGIEVSNGKTDAQDQTLSPQVQKLIDYFLNQGPAEPHQPRSGSAQSPGKANQPEFNRPSATIKAAGNPQPNDFSPASKPGISVSSTSDPSYVFFRSIADSADGPIGALGVPLTAGRSVAVDPRTTPLGAPVFIASGDLQGNSQGFSRLMVAQDTGGAIRGPVRADYFWGFGRQAGTRAFQMKDSFRMWVLIPKGLDMLAKQREKVRTRSIGLDQADDCLISDPEFCAE